MSVWVRQVEAALVAAGGMGLLWYTLAGYLVDRGKERAQRVLPSTELVGYNRMARRTRWIGTAFTAAVTGLIVLTMQQVSPR